MRFSAVLMVFAMAFASPALAQNQRAQALQQFMQWDANGDGAVSVNEAERGRAAMFARLDVNRDGALDEAERAGAGRSGQALGRADTDGDGAVSRAEAMAAPYRMFDRLDANDDNVVSAQEIEAARAMIGGG